MGAGGVGGKLAEVEDALDDKEDTWRGVGRGSGGCDMFGDDGRCCSAQRGELEVRMAADLAGEVEEAVVVVEFVGLVADGVDEVDNNGGGGSGNGTVELESTRMADEVLRDSVVRGSG